MLNKTKQNGLFTDPCFLKLRVLQNDYLSGSREKEKDPDFHQEFPSSNNVCQDKYYVVTIQCFP